MKRYMKRFLKRRKRNLARCESLLKPSTPKLQNPEWWGCVKAIVKLLQDGYYKNIQESSMKEDLRAGGFSEASINKAFLWVDKSLRSGSLAEIASMFSPPRKAQRVHDPLEWICVPKEILNKIDELKRQGVLGEDLCERLLEGVRCADARDWDQDDIRAFLKDMIMAAYEDSPQSSFLSLAHDFDRDTLLS